MLDFITEVLDRYRLEDCDEMFGDTIQRHVTWKNNADLSAIAGQTVRIRFFLRDADFFSFHFEEGK